MIYFVARPTFQVFCFFFSTIKLWNLEANTNVHTFEGHHCVNAIAFSPDGKYLAGGSNDKYIVDLKVHWL